ncbi:hypothetical protein YC2023_106502 [Brassica napus]
MNGLGASPIEKVQIKAWSDWTLGDRTLMCYVELFYRQETVNISEIKLSNQFWIIGRESLAKVDLQETQHTSIS